MHLFNIVTTADVNQIHQNVANTHSCRENILRRHIIEIAALKYRYYSFSH